MRRRVPKSAVKAVRRDWPSPTTQVDAGTTTPVPSADGGSTPTCGGHAVSTLVSMVGDGAITGIGVDGDDVYYTDGMLAIEAVPRRGGASRIVVQNGAQAVTTFEHHLFFEASSNPIGVSDFDLSSLANRPSNGRRERD